MRDTEWPRYEVIKQDTPHAPPALVGSVHAPDPHMALLEARHVFVRRPAAHALWVAPAEAFFHLVVDPKEGLKGEEAPQGEKGVYLVFRKGSHRRSMVYGELAGAVEAEGYLDAAHKALLELPGPFLALWVVPEKAVHKTPETPELKESWFEPAKEKRYRLQSYYGLIEAKKGVR